ncbi:MAG TPA: hypothetical protein DD620_00315 [Verrucomicrobia bacterium]|nr:hypothetical protein [Verrucomicrobiota bacterium]
MKGGPGATYLCKGAAGVGADGKALVRLVWGCSEERMNAEGFILAKLDEGGAGAVDMIGFKVGQVESEHSVGGKNLKGSEDECVCTGVEFK